MSWTIDNLPRQRGKTILVTGSNAGIGFATAHMLARRGARVLMACRTASKGEAAIARILDDVPGADVSMVALDLADLASVRSAAQSILKDHGRLDVLINNAGLMMPPLQRTSDGFELQFGTNVLGHFALTGLLLPLLNKTAHARVVSLGSIAHWDGQIDFDNLNSERRYGRWRAYAQSKLANIIFAYELERRLRRAGESTISLAAHPGGTKSELQRNNLMLKVISVLSRSLTQPTEDGALPSLRAATDPGARGGEYYGPSKLLTMSGPPALQRSSKRSHDHVVAGRLWRQCEQLTDVHYLS